MKEGGLGYGIDVLSVPVRAEAQTEEAGQDRTDRTGQDRTGQGG